MAGVFSVQAHVRADEVVVQEVEAAHVNVVLELLAESVGASSEPPHSHSHGEVLTFDM